MEMIRQVKPDEGEMIRVDTRTGEYMEFEAPLPPYFTDFVKTLHAEDK